MGTNGRGDIFVGTDRELLIYGAGGWFDLLYDERGASEAFDRLKQEHLAASVSVPATADASPSTRLTALREQQSDLESLDDLLTPGTLDLMTAVVHPGASDILPTTRLTTPIDAPTAQVLRTTLAERRAAYQMALRDLRNTAPSIADEVAPNGAKITPAMLRQRFDPAWSAKAATIEYQLSQDTLTIRLTTSDHTIIRQVDVARPRLFPTRDTALTILKGPADHARAASMMAALSSLVWQVSLGRITSH